MKAKKPRYFRYLLLVFLIISLWWITRLIGCGTNPASSHLAPQIISVNPVSNASNVAGNTHISVTFDTDMDPPSISSSSFTLTGTQAAVTGSVTYDAGTKTATFIPNSPLLFATKYTASLNDAIKDSAGNHLVAYQWDFTTLTPITLTGVPDASFGTNGYIMVDNVPGGGVQNNSIEEGNGLLLDPSNRILVVGRSAYLQIFAVMTLWRYSGGGLADNNFGGNGGKQLYSDPVSRTEDFNYYGLSVALDNQQRIVVAGYRIYKNVSNLVVWRFTPNGTPDNTFNGSGVYVGTDNSARGNAVAVDASNHIYIAGVIRVSTPAVVSNGTIWEFDDSGTVIKTFGNQGQGDYNALKIANGKIVAVGGQSGQSMIINRFLLDGSVDSSLNGSGQVSYSGNAMGNACTIDNDGMILVAGYLWDYSTGSATQKIALWRYDDTGKADSTLNGTGLVTEGDYCIGSAVELDNNQKIIIAGTQFNLADSTTDLEIWRLNSDGSHDNNFGNQGIFVGNLPYNNLNGGFISVGSMALDPAGYLLICGSVQYSGNHNMFVWKFR